VSTRVRWDRSQVEVTARDVAALGWIADQYAIRADALAVLLRRLTSVGPDGWPSSAPGPVALGERRVRRIIERWGRAGWVHRYRLLGHAWVVPRPAGIALAGRAYREWTPNARMLDHIHATGLVRLAVEARLPGAPWRCERELRRLVAAGERKAIYRLPDAEVVTDGGIYGVEVELTQKDQARFERNLRLIDPATADTTYFVPPGLAERLARWLAAANQQRQAGGYPPFTVRVAALPEVPGTSYGGAR